MNTKILADYCAKNEDKNDKTNEVKSYYNTYLLSNKIDILIRQNDKIIDLLQQLIDYFYIKRNEEEVD